MLRQKSILNLFGRSPIRPLQQHMEKAKVCVDLLLPLMNAVIDQNWDKVKDYQTQISILEREADDLKRDLRSHLPKSLFLPFPRGDLLELLSGQEMLANTAKDIAGIILGRKMLIPTELLDRFIPFLSRCVDAANQTDHAINELDELLETGFRGKQVTWVEQLIGEIGKIESETDQMQVALRESLFRIEKNLAPIDVMFLYKVIELIGEIADAAQQTGNRLLLLIAS